jgi:hypothetical protein
MNRRKTELMPSSGPCRRCGRSTVADYCRDCLEVDPVFCADRRSRTELAAIRKEHNDWARSFWDDTYRIGRIGYRTPEQKAARTVARREAEQEQAATG